MTGQPITILGGGLAGCEAALFLSAKGVPTRIVEMRPVRRSAVHETDALGELVCSNSLGSINPCRAPGALKAEMDALGSPLLSLARACAVRAGNSLAVDRARFAAEITRRLQTDPLVTIERAEATDLPDPPAIVATGPVTSEPFAARLAERFGGRLYFYDAVAPVVATSSLDLARGFFGSRYGQPGDSDYFNVPLTRPQYETFLAALLSAEVTPLAEHDKAVFYESCLPVEEMARRGPDTLRYGPMKPVGFAQQCGFSPYAVVQLRRENEAGDAWNLVGFQTRMKFGEQRRVLSTIPGFADVEILRHGVMHRNFYLHSPALLAGDLSLRDAPGIFFAGQMTGVEGYVESIATGLLAAVGAFRRLRGLPRVEPDRTTMIGALLAHVSGHRGSVESFVPMNANFGIVDFGFVPRKNERQRVKETFHERSVPKVVETWGA